MRVIETQEEMFAAQEPITVNALLKLRHDVIWHTSRIPQIAKFAHGTYATLLAELPPDALPKNVDVEKIFGMTIEIDSNLRNGEWYIGYRRSITREVGNG